MLPKGRHITPKWAWLWSRDCFKISPFAVMQHVMWVHQRQLSYLLYIIVFTLFHTCRNLNSNFILAFTLPHSHC